MRHLFTRYIFLPMRSLIGAFALLLLSATAQSQTATVLVPGSVFDGTNTSLHRDWIVVVAGSSITYAGPNDASRIPAGAKRMELPGLTLLPGLIDAHVHFFPQCVR